MIFNFESNRLLEADIQCNAMTKASHVLLCMCALGDSFPMRQALIIIAL